MSQVYFYCNQDSYAPSIGNNFVTMTNLFKKCLVEGYGGKPPAGWSMPFYDETSQVVVFRAGGGSRKFLRLQWAPQTSYLFGYGASLYTSMDSKDSGTGRRPADTNLHCALAFPLSINGHWAMVADDRSFWFCWGSSGTKAGFVFVGELDTIVANDQNGFCLPGTTGALPVLFGSWQYPPTLLKYEDQSNHPIKAYGSNFSQSSDMCTLLLKRPGGAVLQGRTFVGQTTSSPAYPFLDGILLYGRIPVTEGYDLSFRGFLPGAIELMHNNIGNYVDINKGYYKTTLGNKNVVIFINPSITPPCIVGIDLDTYRVLDIQ